MGASQSSSSGGGRAGGAGGSGRPTTAEGIDVQDYYGLLELPDPDEQIASPDEIRKAYRRLALRYHPDKNLDNVEAANERFRLLQVAYEILSDEQERAWYDSHREQILKGFMDPDGTTIEEEEALDEETFQQFRTGQRKPPPAPTGSSLPGLTSRQILRFMDASLCIDVAPPSADETGFYATFRRIFERLADEEKGAAPYPGEQSEPFEVMPGFGYSHTPYSFNKKGSADEEDTVHQTQVREFYAVWMSFQTRKGFAWRDGYRLNDAPDRRVRRAMEKENKQMRDECRREYNDTVRSLVMFVRKRDPRFKAYVASQASNSAASQEEMQRRREAAAREMREQQERARAYKQQSWDDWEHGGADGESEDEYGSDGSFGQDAADLASSNDEDEDEEDGNAGDMQDGEDDLICYACDKVFQSAASFANHEQSKKHKKQVWRVKRDMLKEDRELQKGMQGVEIVDDLEEEDATSLHEQPQPKAEEEDPTAGLSKKAKQRLKKRLKEQEKLANSSGATSTAQVSEEEREEAVDQPIADPVDTQPDNDELQANTTKKSRRAKKSANAKERCNVCKTPFDSRSKLFSHIRETGHALATAEPTPAKGNRR